MGDPTVKVAVGVVRDEAGRVLVALRQSGQHLAGLWEFPGGKIEPGESCEQALHRELYEETGIQLVTSRSLIVIRHQYPQKTVELDVRLVESFTGTARGREGQQIRWVNAQDLPQLAFPEANRPIVAATLLPPRIMITGKFESSEQLLAKCQRAWEKGIRVIQFRAPWLNQPAYAELLLWLREQLDDDLRLFANTDPVNPALADYPYWHFSSSRLKKYQRPRQAVWLSSACHTNEELNLAEAAGVDFVYFSPVKSTQSHPTLKGRGWDVFREICKAAKIPVYSLGGMEAADEGRAIAEGGQGIAAISAFWDSHDSESSVDYS